jgi:hypothetical protein
MPYKFQNLIELNRPQHSEMSEALMHALTLAGGREEGGGGWG